MTNSPPPNSSSDKSPPRLDNRSGVETVTTTGSNSNPRQSDLRNSPLEPAVGASEPGRSLQVLLGIVMLLVIVGVAVVILKPATNDLPRTNIPAEADLPGLGEILEGLDATPKPHSLNPGPILNHVKDVARSVEEHQRCSEDLINSPMTGTSDCNR